MPLGNRAQSEWGSIYLIIIFIIAALLLIAFVKPLFTQSQHIAENQPVVKGK